MKIQILVVIILFFCNYSFSATNHITNELEAESQADSIPEKLQYLKQFTQGDEWHFYNPEAKKSINGLIHFLEDENIDSILIKINSIQNGNRLVSRNWWDVTDTLNIPGYTTSDQIKEKMLQLDREVRDQNPLEKIPIPEYLLTNLENKIQFISKENTQTLISNGIIVIPDSLKNNTNAQGSVKLNSNNVQQDSTIFAFVEKARKDYNDKLLKDYIDSISYDYRVKAINFFSDSLQNQLKKSLRLENQRRIMKWNDAEIATINDSIRKILPILSDRANKMPQDVWIYNLSNDYIKVRTRNNDLYFTRMFLKNEQKDSLGIKIENLGRSSMRILIDDGVTFTRFREQQKRDIALETNSTPTKKDFGTVTARYNVTTPWTLSGTSSLGITQLGLNNWKSGGNSSFSILGELTGKAVYSQNKTKWENSIELSDGWVKYSKIEDEPDLQKSSDDLELISKLGYTATKNKKWYYSTEIDFETQLFRGYDYDDDPDTPISSFLAPGELSLKLGMEYNPNKKLSLVVSPLTSKTVFVKDTSLVDQTTYGIDEDKKVLWKAGLNTDFTYTKTIMDNITWTADYSLFTNYQNPLKKFDLDFKNTLTMQVNNFIKITMALYLLYDDDVTWATDKTDAEGNTIYETRWQTKELITVGFSYSMDRKLYRRQRIK